jgi:hypothetical protein
VSQRDTSRTPEDEYDHYCQCNPTSGGRAWKASHYRDRLALAVADGLGEASELIVPDLGGLAADDSEILPDCGRLVVKGGELVAAITHSLGEASKLSIPDLHGPAIEVGKLLAAFANRLCEISELSVFDATQLGSSITGRLMCRLDCFDYAKFGTRLRVFSAFDLN